MEIDETEEEERARLVARKEELDRQIAELQELIRAEKERRLFVQAETRRMESEIRRNNEIARQIIHMAKGVNLASC